MAEFFGRKQELAWLRGLWNDCTARDKAGVFSNGPRMAFIIAETGIGKSRLVQALYQQLTTDEHWDPEHIDYWPDAFQLAGEQIRVNPDHKDHIPKGPPRFLWLGMRWHSSETRNVEERTCAIPSARDSLRAHVTIADRHRSAWEQLRSQTARAAKRDGVSETLSQAVDAVIPFGGLALKLLKGGADFVRDRTSGDRSLSREQEKQINDAAEEFVSELREVFGGVGSAGCVLPTVLWLDDAQWIDPLTLKFLNMVWAEATRHKWPLLVVVTHWEREWRELQAEQTSQQRLSDFTDQPGVETKFLTLGANGDLNALAQDHFPGLTAAQRDLLVKKASGNFLTMVENLGELSTNLDAFQDGDPAKAFTTEGETFVQEWESLRHKRVEQRFGKLASDVKKLLGWGSVLGNRFLSGVVIDYAKIAAANINAQQALDACINPYAILGSPNPYTREFRDRAFQVAARKYFDQWSKSHFDKLHGVLREHLTGWINRSFNDSGDIILRDEENDSWTVPQDAAIFLGAEERRDLLGMAHYALPLPEQPDWSNPEHVASLRARILSSWTDEQDHLYDLVREHGKSLAFVQWSSVPESVVSIWVRGITATDWQTAGALSAALGLYGDLLAKYQTINHQQNTPESRRDVSVSLDNVANIELQLGKHESALKKYTESLEIARALEQELGTPQSRRYVSYSLNNFACMELQLEKYESALEKYTESLEICRALEQELGTPQSRHDVSVLLNGVAGAGIELQLENHESALAKYTESLDIARALEQELGSPQSRSDVSVSLGDVADIELQLGNHESALAKYTESLDIARALEQELGTPQSRRDVSVSLDKVAGIELRLGNHESALEKYTASLEIARALEQELGTPASRRDVSVSLDNVADIELKLAKHESALANYTESLKIRRALEQDLGTPASRRDVSLSLDNVADIEIKLAKHESALAKYTESLEICRGLEQELGTPESRRDVSLSLDNVADIELKLGNHESALAKYTESLEIRRVLEQELGTPESRRDVSVSLNRVANIELSQGNHESALTKYKESLDIRRALEQELGTPESRRDVSFSLDNVADIELQLGNHESALEKYTESLEIFRALADQLGTIDYINAVAWNLCLISRIIIKQDPAKALAIISEGHQMSSVLSDPDQQDLNILDTAATVWEVTSESLRALERRAEADVAQLKAEAIRERITGA
jgi:tetratricopeptide (TPR) repeat protein